ncbi:MAG: hypothetical protein IK012_00850 [Fibrobacter sp.]|uniref:hypothetical protein n=1 Tax=Fibrobacter sp. TaxID=35828 RepID=UPI0025BC0972|nr:hypothetical protein [Fibrobacter sp.]MBR4783792.1 hypothetical protein [Fibrobacter sp.]
MAEKKLAASAKLTATIAKKNDAIANAQASALIAAIKTDADVAAFQKNPATFAKKKGIDLTPAFTTQIKNAVATKKLDKAFKAQLTESVAKRLADIIIIIIVNPPIPVPRPTPGCKRNPRI